MACSCEGCDNPPKFSSRKCSDCLDAGCNWADECVKEDVCFRCGGEPETSDFDGKAVCSDCIEKLNNRDTARDTDQAALENF